MNKQLPSRKTALDFLKAIGCSKNVIDHCKKVADLAVEIAKMCRKNGVKVDVNLVHIGALLHDAGRAKTHTIEHGIIGAQIARAWDFPEAVVSIIENHVGSGISKAEAEKLGWPAKDYIPVTIEGQIVSYADKLIEGSIRVPIEVAIERFRQDKNIPKTSVERLKQWHEELTECMK